MKGDAGVLDYLNWAPRSELTAINQRWLPDRLQRGWGYGRLAKTSREESLEETHHADRIMDRIIFLDGHPNLQVLDRSASVRRPRRRWNATSPPSTRPRSLCIEARDHCERVRDHPSKQLFEELIADEQGHIDHLETQLVLIGRIGEANWGQLNGVPTDEAEGDD